MAQWNFIIAWHSI